MTGEPSPRTALLLPGQGAQFVGMGRELAETHPEVRNLYEEADDLLSTPLSRICWEGPAETLTRTDNAQPAILLHSYAVWRCVRESLEGTVVVAAGHSLGEFTAHLLAGTFSFPDALRVVRRRGELMAEAGSRRPGTMAAILGLEPAEVTALCEAASGETRGVVVPANFNAPGQVVVSGDVAAVERAAALAPERGARRVVPLDVSGAFHSPLMEAARDGLERVLEEVELEDPRFPVVANARAEAVTTADEARRSLVEQLTSPVRWVEGLGRMRERSPDRWLELGPGRVLSGLLRRLDRDLEAVSVGDPEGVETVRKKVRRTEAPEDGDRARPGRAG